MNELIDEIEVREPENASWYVTPLLTQEQCEKILLAVAKGRGVQNAARENGSSLLTVMRFRLSNKAFNSAMNEALQLRVVMLEDKAWELAYDGVEETIILQNGNTRTRTEFPTANLLQFLLKAYAPDKYGIDRKEVKAGPLDAPPETVKSGEDRQKLIDRIEARRRDRSDVIDAQIIATSAEFADLL